MSRRTPTAVACFIAVVAIAGCGGGTSLLHKTSSTPSAPVPTPGTTATATPRDTASTGATATATTSAPPQTTGPAKLGFPYLATKNTTRVAGTDPISDAAAVALATFPSTVPGTHPTAVTVAPTDDWQAALAASSLEANPFNAALLLSGAGTLPTATHQALNLLAPTGNKAVGGAQVIRVGDVPAVSGSKSVAIAGSDPYSLAAAIDTFEARQRGKESVNVLIASAQYPEWAMPAAGYAAESGEPILYANDQDVPAATQEALLAHRHPHIYILGPTSVIPNSVAQELAHYGVVHRISANSPAALAVVFAEYRDPACPPSGQCAHIPGSFGWAIRSPGHGFVLINQAQTLDAAASAELSASGGFGPQLLLEQPNTLPQVVLNYLVGYATPGYNSAGPTTAVYNHAWLIGGSNLISESVQGQVDSLLEPVEAK